MKVVSAVLFLAIFWSQEWEPVNSDSIIHIGKCAFSQNQYANKGAIPLHGFASAYIWVAYL